MHKLSWVVESLWRSTAVPIAFLHSQRVAINLLQLFSKWSFPVSFLSRMALRYLACLEISRRCPFSSSIPFVLHVYRLVKITTSVLPEFTDSPVVRYQVSTTFSVCSLRPSVHSNAFRVPWLECHQHIQWGDIPGRWVDAIIHPPLDFTAREIVPWIDDPSKGGAPFGYRYIRVS